MERKPTQRERSGATRAALVAAARPLFARRGYGGVGAEEIVAAAGVTRGALYHHFGGKEGLLAAVYEQIEQELLERIGARVAEQEATDPLAALATGAQAFLDACSEPEIHRIVLLDAPSVLGWERWREIGWRYGAGLTEGVVQAAIDAGRIARQPAKPLAHLLLGALDEAALYVARAPEPAVAREEAGAAIAALLEGLRTRTPGRSSRAGVAPA
jgi:AcrR family transcriptional regulator